MAHSLEVQGANTAQVPDPVAIEEQRLMNLALGQSQNDRSTEDSALQRAMLESLRASNSGSRSNALTSSEDAEIQRAIQMSMQSGNVVDEVGTDLQRAVQLSMSGVDINDIVAITNAKHQRNPNSNANPISNQNPFIQPPAISAVLESDTTNDPIPVAAAPPVEVNVDVNSDEKRNAVNINSNEASALSMEQIYNLIPQNPSTLRDEMKTETFSNRLRESQRIKEEIAESERRLRELKASLSTFDDIGRKEKALSAWNTLLRQWREWNIDGFHHYLMRIENGKYRESLQDKAVFIQRWQRIVTDDNGDRFNNDHTFYGHYLNAFESEDLQDLGITNRQDRRRVMSQLRSLTTDQFEGML